MRNIKSIVYLMAIGGLSILNSCADDPVTKDPSPGYEHILNKPLVEALKKQGFKFSDDGELVIDKSVRETKELDLSSSKIKTLYGLSHFESLESLDISDNLLGESLDCSHLPKSVKELDLSENNQLKNYLKINDLSLEKLLLPTQGRWDSGDIVRYAQHENGQKADIDFLLNDGRKLDFTFEREINDKALATSLKSLYPSIFTPDGLKIDLRKDLEEDADLILNEAFDNLSGVEYILNHNQFKPANGKVALSGSANKPYSIEYMYISKNVKSLKLKNISTPNGLVVCKESQLRQLIMNSNAGLKDLQLDQKFWGEQINHTHFFKYGLILIDCPLLENISFPKQPAMTGRIYLQNLPALKEVDLLQIKAVHTISLDGLDIAKLQMPLELLDYPDGWGGSDDQRKIMLAFGDQITSQSTVRSFIDRQKEVSVVVEKSSTY